MRFRMRAERYWLYEPLPRNITRFTADVARVASLTLADAKFILVQTFNEWHEGTELEPSTEFGDMYLKLTRELAGGLRGK